MSLVKQALFIDLINNFWIVGFFVALFWWLPTTTVVISSEESKISQASSNSEDNELTLNVSRIIGCYLRITLGLTIGTISLSYLHFLNWLTLILLYIALLFISYLEMHNWQIKSCQEKFQNKIFKFIDIFDRGLSLRYLLENFCCIIKQQKNQVVSYLDNLIVDQGIIYIISFSLILVFTFFLRWEYPLSELRFSHQDLYHNLLITQQIITGNYPETNYLPVFPALAAVLSILGSVDTIQVIRFFSPILGGVTVLSIGYFVSVFSKNSFSALVAMFALGIYLFTWKQILDPSLPLWLIHIIDSLNNSLVRQWTGNELEIGIISLLLGLGYCVDNQQRQKSNAFKVNIVCGLILIAISAPSLLILMAIAPIGLLGGRKLTIIGVTAIWITLAIFAALASGKLIWTQDFLLSLPIALSLLSAIIFDAIVELGKTISPKWAETFCWALAIALSCNFLLPLAPQLTYLEYDIAARKTLEIKNFFPRNSWTLVAPTEQLTQIYGSGWYEDLALFVEKYGNRAANPQFNFPISDTDLFIFVEKIPFVTFPNEPTLIPNSILGDRTYYYYRSSAGRASLEFEALQMCEAYRENHDDSQIYFENLELRVYQFPRHSS